MVLSGEQRLALKHLSKDAASAPNVDLDIVLLPREHDLGGPIVSGGDIARHLRVLNSRQPEVADLQIAVLVHQDVTRLQIAVDYACRVNVFQAPLSPC